jgi:hypothetical protein
MFDAVTNNILKLFEFIILFFILIIIIGFGLRLLFKKVSLTTKKTKIYGIFLHLNNLSIVALGVVFIKYIFILWCLYRCINIEILHLIFLIIISLIFNISIKNYKGLIFDIINSIFIYLSIKSLGILISYINDISFIWYVFAISILLSIFIILYNSYFFIRNIYDIGQKNKYSRSD